MTQPVVLVVLDGFGLAPEGPGNAVALARTPVFDALWERCAHTSLTASGLAVGLPERQMGNSEVGHLNIGAGRIVAQDLVRIDNAVADGSLGANPALQEAFAAARAARGVLHLAGLVSDGGVHSHVDHLRAIVGAALASGVPASPSTPSPTAATSRRTRPRACSPSWSASGPEAGPSSPPSSGATTPWIATTGSSARSSRARRLSTVWASMPRRRRRPSRRPTRRGSRTSSSSRSCSATRGCAWPRAIPLVFFNFRPDRARQMSHALAPVLGLLVTMTRYDDTLGARVAFDDVPLQGTLADVLEAAGVRQLHVAETEKYAHVTYFFDGGREQRHDGEDWELVSSRRDVPTYDFAPEMSAAGVAQRLAERLPDGYGFAIVNLANPDMVGHSGVLPAVITAVEASDAALGVILAAVERAGGAALVTADHGNAEQMLEPDGSPHTAHTTNPVPARVHARGCAPARRRQARRPRADGARPARHRAVAGDDRPEPAHLVLRPGSSPLRGSGRGSRPAPLRYADALHRLRSEPRRPRNAHRATAHHERLARSL